MGTCGAFLDGGYIDKVMLHNHPDHRVDYQRLVAEMSAGHELLRAYYYNCLPYQSNPPTEEERARYASARRFTDALNRLPRFEVRLGQLAKGLDATGAVEFTQKRVDNMVGVDMALLAAKGRITHLCLFSGDSDFIPSVEAVKREGVIVTLWHGRFGTRCAPSRELYDLCDERRELNRERVFQVRRT